MAKWNSELLFQNLVKYRTGLYWGFFLKKTIKDEFILLKSEGGINFLFMSLKTLIKNLQSLQLSTFISVMNYLAHAYLSFGQAPVTIGNMISDHVKGKKQFDYPSAVQKGIRLHRLIDQFTDDHEATKELKSFFRPQYRLYSGAFADVVYDHFLATDDREFISEKALKDFAMDTYVILGSAYDMLPVTFQKMFPYMKEYDWLYNYRHKWGIEKSFNGLVRRSAYLAESKIAFEIFNERHEAMKQCYDAFFPSLKKYAAGQLSELLNS